MIALDAVDVIAYPTGGNREAAALS